MPSKRKNSSGRDESPVPSGTSGDEARSDDEGKLVVRAYGPANARPTKKSVQSTLPLVAKASVGQASPAEVPTVDEPQPLVVPTAVRTSMSEAQAAAARAEKAQLALKAMDDLREGPSKTTQAQRSPPRQAALPPPAPAPPVQVPAPKGIAVAVIPPPKGITAAALPPRHTAAVPAMAALAATQAGTFDGETEAVVAALYEELQHQRRATSTRLFEHEKALHAVQAELKQTHADRQAFITKLDGSISLHAKATMENMSLMKEVVHERDDLRKQMVDLLKLSQQQAAVAPPGNFGAQPAAAAVAANPTEVEVVTQLLFEPVIPRLRAIPSQVVFQTPLVTRAPLEPQADAPSASLMVDYDSDVEYVPAPPPRSASKREVKSTKLNALEVRIMWAVSGGQPSRCARTCPDVCHSSVIVS